MPNSRRASPANGFLNGNPHRPFATGTDTKEGALKCSTGTEATTDTATGRATA